MIADGEHRDSDGRDVTKRPPYPSGAPAGICRTAMTRVSERHRRFELVVAAARRRDPVECEPRPHRVEPRTRVRERAGRIREVHDSRRNAGRRESLRPGAQRSTCSAVRGGRGIFRGCEVAERARDPRPRALRRTSASAGISSGRKPSRPMPVSSLSCTGSASPDLGGRRGERPCLLQVVQRGRQTVGAVLPDVGRLRAVEQENLARDTPRRRSATPSSATRPRTPRLPRARAAARRGPRRGRTRPP